MEFKFPLTTCGRIQRRDTLFAKFQGAAAVSLWTSVRLIIGNMWSDISAQPRIVGITVVDEINFSAMPRRSTKTSMSVVSRRPLLSSIELLPSSVSRKSLPVSRNLFVWCSNSLNCKPNALPRILPVYLFDLKKFVVACPYVLLALVNLCLWKILSRRGLLAISTYWESRRAKIAQ